MTLVARLAALVQDIAELRAVQRHAAQAAAARHAAEHLHAVRTAYATRIPGSRARPRKPPHTARLDFPTPPTTARTATSPAPGMRKHDQPELRPSRGQRPPRTRGPTR
jgi:hypothetical protein